MWRLFIGVLEVRSRVLQAALLHVSGAADETAGDDGDSEQPYMMATMKVDAELDHQTKAAVIAWDARERAIGCDLSDLVFILVLKRDTHRNSWTFARVIETLYPESLQKQWYKCLQNICL